MATKNIIPRNNDEGQIGSSSKKWASAFISDGTFDTLSVAGQAVSGGGATALSGLSDVTISNLQNDQVLKYNGANWVNAAAPATLSDTDGLSEGSNNLYFTNARSRSSISVTDSGGDGSLSYNSSSGVLTYTGPSAAETRAHFSAGGGVTLSSGVISISGTSITSAMLSGNITNNKLNTITEADKVSGSAIQLSSVTAIENDSGLKIKDTFAGSSLVMETSGVKQILNQINDILVTVSAGKFLLNGISQKKIVLETGTVYRFDVSDSSVSTHPLKFSTTSDGTHNSGSEYTTGITSSGTQGNSGAFIQLDLRFNTVQDVLYYYCSAHSGMGSAIYTSIPDTDQISEGSNNLYFTNERVDDRVDALITAGTGITSTYNDSAGTLTLASDATLANVVAAGSTSTSAITVSKVGIGLNSSGNAAIGYISTQGSSNYDLNLDPQGSGIVTISGNATRGSGSIKLNCENNSHGITIKSPPHSAGATYTLTLPINDGNSDQVLRTNGSGFLSWVDQSSGGGSSTTLQSTVSSTLTLTGATSGTHVWIFNGSTITITLPTTGITDGTIYHLKNINSTKAVISGPIDNVTSKDINQYDNLTVVATGSGSQWYII